MGMGLETLCQKYDGMLQKSVKVIFSRINELSQEAIDIGISRKILRSMFSFFESMIILSTSQNAIDVLFHLFKCVLFYYQLAYSKVRYKVDRIVPKYTLGKV